MTETQMRRILFQGTPTVKGVKHYSHPDVEAEVTPLVVIQNGQDVWGDNELHWGLVLQCTPRSVLEEVEDPTEALKPFEIDSTFSAWSNPTRWWRALQLLEAMPVLNHRNLGLNLWIAAGRPAAADTCDHDRIEELCNTFEEGYTYEEIMGRPVPLEIVQLSIKLVDEGLDMHGMQHNLTDEIDVSTIRWSQELKRIGVSHPEYRRAVQAARAVVVARYEAHLFSYAAFREYAYGHDRVQKCFIMSCIEWCIYDLIERGIEETYGKEITAMIAILYEEITSDDILETLEKKHPRDREGRELAVRPTQEEHFAHVITWMTERFPQAGTLPQKEELDQRLHHLYRQWESLPVVNPLVS